MSTHDVYKKGDRYGTKLPKLSANQRLPSRPRVIPNGPLLGVGTGISLINPAVVLLPILLPLNSVNQRLPSGPAVMPAGLFPDGIRNSQMDPAVVILPIFPAKVGLGRLSVNHMAPSGPEAMP